MENLYEIIPPTPLQIDIQTVREDIEDQRTAVTEELGPIEASTDDIKVKIDLIWEIIRDRQSLNARARITDLEPENLPSELLKRIILAQATITLHTSIPFKIRHGGGHQPTNTITLPIEVRRLNRHGQDPISYVNVTPATKDTVTSFAITAISFQQKVSNNPKSH